MFTYTQVCYHALNISVVTRSVYQHICQSAYIKFLCLLVYTVCNDMLCTGSLYNNPQSYYILVVYWQFVQQPSILLYSGGVLVVVNNPQSYFILVVYW